MSYRSKIWSMMTAFASALFPSNNEERTSTDRSDSLEDNSDNIEDNTDNVESTSSENEPITENEQPKNITRNRSIISIQANRNINSTNSRSSSLVPLFENRRSVTSGSEWSSSSNDFCSQLQNTDYIEALRNVNVRHKAMSPLINHKSAPKMFKNYVSPNPFFNFLRDFRINETNKYCTLKRPCPAAPTITKKAGKIWRKMAPDEKVYYRAQAAAAKDRLKMVASKILKRYPSRKYLSKNVDNRNSRKSVPLPYIS